MDDFRSGWCLEKRVVCCCSQIWFVASATRDRDSAKPSLRLSALDIRVAASLHLANRPAMDAHTQIPSRLRLHRNSFSFAAATLDENDSHLMRDLHDEDEDDNRSTPRVNGISKMSVDSYDSQSDFDSARAISTPAPVDREQTPAARLRALLARVPGSATPKATARPRSPSLSGLESNFAPDMDTGAGNASMSSDKLATPYPKHSYSPSPPASAAHRSVRDIFSKARQELITPEKPKRNRRNSVGSATQVSPAPAATRYPRSKRVSFSDDEVEKLTSTSVLCVRRF